MGSYISQGKQLLMSTGFYQKWYDNQIEIIILIYLRFHKKFLCNSLQSFAACLLCLDQLWAPIPHFSPHRWSYAWIVLKWVLLAKKPHSHEGLVAKTKDTLANIEHFCNFFFITKFCNKILHSHFCLYCKIFVIFYYKIL